MKQVEQAEKSLSGLFKDFPPLSKDARESIVKIMPVLALVFGVLQIIAGYYVWRLANLADRIADAVNSYAAFYTVPTTHISAFDRTVIYLGAVVLVIEGIIGLMAYKELSKRSARGWDLLFLAALLNVAYAVVAIFIQGRGFGSFIMSLVGSAIGFYLLFQIKSAYGKSAAHDQPVVK
jgi:hypothetical protein